MDVGDDGDSQGPVLARGNDNCGCGGALAPRHLAALEELGAERPQPPRPRSAALLHRRAAGGDGELRALHQDRPRSSRSSRPSSRSPIFARRAPRVRPEHRARPHRSRPDRGHGRPDDSLGGRPPVLDRTSLVGGSPRPHEGSVGRVAGRTMGHARWRGRVRDAPDRGHHGLRPAVPALSGGCR